ncbi:hypothetical protein SAHL_15320 [Salinisphaera orenii YIM 95161]|uniref:Uncharacterized protein n=1 Tax=Salinisphaera orenii YIM 95161 TaxID=1051139 RepID=A0A423PHX5_9GAMM|nr:hypothetical protein SAHL_15320 [Salinisphaera halophila YIM 95161]
MRGLPISARIVAVIAAVALCTALVAPCLAFAVAAPRLPVRAEAHVVSGITASLVALMPATVVPVMAVMAIMAVGAPVIVVVAIVAVVDCAGVRATMPRTLAAAVVVGAAANGDNGEQEDDSGGHGRLCRGLCLEIRAPRLNAA